jgi:hypothetical protein
MAIFTAPDSNVRPEGARLRSGPRDGRRSHLARLLLMPSPRVPNPLALILVVASMSACITPVAPEFQDPAASPNYAPYIQSVSPPFGSVVSIPLSQNPVSQNFQVTVTDPNVEDNLFYRWVADYPPYTTNTRTLADAEFPHMVNGQPQDAVISRTIGCTDTLAITADGQHRLEVIVADRPFAAPIPPDMSLDLVNPPGFVVRASWTFQIACQSPPPPS